MHVTHGVVHLGGGCGGVGGGDGGKSNGVKKRERERLTHSIFILLDVRIPSSWILCENVKLWYEGQKKIPFFV